jgi:hypothetical protein
VSCRADLTAGAPAGIACCLDGRGSKHNWVWQVIQDAPASLDRPRLRGQFLVAFQPPADHAGGLVLVATQGLFVVRGGGRLLARLIWCRRGTRVRRPQ